MPTYQLSGFGEIDLSNLEDYYDAQADLNGRTVALDMNFEEYAVNKEKLEAVDSVVSNLVLYNDKALKAIQDDSVSGDTVKLYIAQHADMVIAEKTGENKAASDENNMAALLSKLYLKRIGFYPENENEFAVFDYTIGEDVTQYLLVVNFKKMAKLIRWPWKADKMKTGIQPFSFAECRLYSDTFLLFVFTS